MTLENRFARELPELGLSWRAAEVANPELLVQWADYQMELSAIMGGYGGTQGSNWDWAKEGDKGINDKQAVFRLQKFPAPAGQSFSQ